MRIVRDFFDPIENHNKRKMSVRDKKILVIVD